MVNNHDDRKSSKDRVVGPLPNGRNFMAYDPVTLSKVVGDLQGSGIGRSK